MNHMNFTYKMSKKHMCICDHMNTGDINVWLTHGNVWYTCDSPVLNSCYFFVKDIVKQYFLANMSKCLEAYLTILRFDEMHFFHSDTLQFSTKRTLFSDMSRLN